MPRLVEAYAQSRGERVIISNGASPDESEIKVIGSDGENRAAIELQAHGSGTATPGLTSGKALIGMASRPLNDSELVQLAQQGLGDMRSSDNEHVLALDGIIVIVSPGNPVAKLSLQQLQGISRVPSPTGRRLAENLATSMFMLAIRSPGLSTLSGR
jgi:phosphate transport system substrate-binding protein